MGGLEKGENGGFREGGKHDFRKMAKRGGFAFYNLLIIQQLEAVVFALKERFSKMAWNVGGTK